MALGSRQGRGIDLEASEGESLSYREIAKRFHFKGFQRFIGSIWGASNADFRLSGAHTRASRASEAWDRASRYSNARHSNDMDRTSRARSSREKFSGVVMALRFSNRRTSGPSWRSDGSTSSDALAPAPTPSAAPAPTHSPRLNTIRDLPDVLPRLDEQGESQAEFPTTPSPAGPRE